VRNLAFSARAASEKRPTIGPAAATQCLKWGHSLLVVCRDAEREVRFCPRTDLIPIRNLGAHTCLLCNRAEGYGHAGSSECSSASAVEQVTGAKPPLRPKHVWSIRTKLQIKGRTRDLALFHLAIDSKLRCCDVVAIRVEDVAAGGTQRIGRRSGKRRLDGLSGLN
jgi:hypothetical protein